ncbi:MAG: nucleotidyltransferase family protein [Clostridia bacterium]|nr:nucleotidyltransferase family protein [Clostridia bacterium]
MKCIVLAAGYATRLYPLTRDFPKPLLGVGGKPILDWLIDDAASMVDAFVVVTNHRFYEHFLRWKEGKEQRIIVLDDGTESNEARLGAVRDIRFALDALAIDEDCAVMAGDNLLDFSLKGFLSYALRAGTSCVMCHEEPRIEALRKTGVIEFDEAGIITSYQEKPQTPRGRYAVPPFYYYLAEDIRRIPEALGQGCGFDAPGSFAAWLSRRAPVHAYVMPGRRYDIGDMESYLKVQRAFEAGAFSTGG